MVRGPKRQNKKRQCKKAAKQQKPRGNRPAVNSDVLVITQVFQSANTNRELALIDTNLRRQNEQFKRMEISWVEEKHKLVQKNRSLQRAVRRKYTHATNEIKRLEGLLKAAEYSKAYEKKKKENLQAALENTLDEFKLQRKIWRLEEEKRTAELKEMQKKCQEQEAVMIKKEKLITMYKRELLALAKENLQTGIRMKDEHDQSVRGWKLKYEALEARLREELAKKGGVKKEHASIKTENSVLSSGEEEELKQ